MIGTSTQLISRVKKGRNGENTWYLVGSGRFLIVVDQQNSWDDDTSKAFVIPVNPIPGLPVKPKTGSSQSPSSQVEYDRDLVGTVRMEIIPGRVGTEC